MRRIPIVKKELNSVPAMSQHITGDLISTGFEEWQLGTEAFKKKYQVVYRCLNLKWHLIGDV